ncbi:MAG: aminotransferase class I/II-fold pyridoxal phosphate-dependent enzyme [Spirochaetota bacterium]|nr:aminotransferase class I/II-fold pyridoxal phosphate-dependent enzyme [Spirochaetota bacterium]
MGNSLNRCAIAYQEVVDTGSLNSDYYTLADFIELDDEDIFKKTVPQFWYIEDHKRKGYFSYQRPLLSACENRVIIYDDFTGTEKEMIMMASNNYLGLISHPRVVQAGIRAYEKYGSGGSSAPLLSGTFDITRELELKLAEFKGCEDAMVFSTGYSANVGVISALLRKNDVAIIDKLNHASIVDGCRLSGASLRVYRHHDMGKLEKCLQKSRGQRQGMLVITDGVFGMDGDICNLPEIKRIADRYGARVMVDDAHATGVIGKQGKGTAEHYGMEGMIDIVMGTFSKSLAGVGGFVASTKEVVNYIRYYARSYFFSAALPPCICATVLAALNVIEEEPELLEQLHQNVKYLHSRFSQMGLEVTQPGTGVISVIIGDEIIVRKMSKQIHEMGLYINPLPFPSVRKGEARFKFSLMATHTMEDLDRAADIFEAACQEYGIIKTSPTLVASSSVM